MRLLFEARIIERVRGALAVPSAFIAEISVRVPLGVRALDAIGATTLLADGVFVSLRDHDGKLLAIATLYPHIQDVAIALGLPSESALLQSLDWGLVDISSPTSRVTIMRALPAFDAVLIPEVDIEATVVDGLRALISPPGRLILFDDRCSASSARTEAAVDAHAPLVVVVGAKGTTILQAPGYLPRVCGLTEALNALSSQE